MKHLLILAFVLPLIIARQTPAQAVDTLIQSLGDPDPSAREKAETTLRAMSKDGSVRPALILASRNGDPAVSTAAARVLLSLPWLQPNDPPEVRALLNVYGNVAEAGRSGLIHQMAQLPRGVAWPTLLRLVMEDPSEEVCWTIASHFHTRITARTGILPRTGRDITSAVTPDIAELVRTQLNPSDNRPAAIVIAARAWEGKDPAKALNLYRQAVEIETRNPTQDNGELDEVFDILVANEIGQTHFDEAANIQRLQCGRIALSQVSANPDPVFALFILHSRYGPLQGFAQDLQNYRDYTGNPEVLYALSRIYSRSGRLMEAMALRRAAQSVNLSSEEHLLLGMWLAQLSWNDLARHEYMATLGNEDPDTLPIRAMGLARLSILASEEDNDVAAMEHLKKEIDISGEPASTPVKAMLACFAARIASANGDQAALKAALDEAVEYRGNQYDITLKLYPLLKAAGRDAEAKRMFDSIFDLQTKALTDMGVDDAETFNNIAWLSSRCDQHLPEAANYAKRALAIDPDNAAYMDTLADAQFRLGKVEEAVELESRALIYRPEDEFMHKQLARFKAGLGK